MTFPIIETDCTITGPLGHTFTANGALFDLDHGGSLYVAPRTPDGMKGDLTTWHGDPVGTYRVVSHWRQYTKHGDWYTVTAIRAHIADREFYGRYGSDWSQLVTLRPSKHAR